MATKSDIIKESVIRQLMLNNNGITGSNIARELKVSKKKVNSILYRLKDDNFCFIDSNFKWFIKETVVKDFSKSEQAKNIEAPASKEELNSGNKETTDIKQEKLDIEMELSPLRSYMGDILFAFDSCFGEVLDNRSKDILRKYIKGRSLTLLAKDYNLTRERIRQIIYSGIKKIRKQEEIVKEKDERIKQLEMRCKKQRLVINQINHEKRNGIKPEDSNVDKLTKQGIIPITPDMFHVRVSNCLNYAEITTLNELSMMSRNDMLKFRHLGKKSVLEIEEVLKQHGLSFID